MIRRTLAALALLLTALIPGTGPASAATSYTNPIKSQKGADPWLRYHDGNYYLITTSFTNTRVIRRSPTLGGLSTAPGVGSNTSAIFLATSTTGAQGSWTNNGPVISTNSSSSYNAIDPNLIVDDQGRWWLSFGSFWTGLKLIPLNPGTGLRSGTAIYDLARRSGGTTAIEAPVIVKHGSSYYLYVSWDACCRGASSTYRVMVGRSFSVTGPYRDRNGTPMTSGGGTELLAGHGSIHGPGHQAVLGEPDGDRLFYHYYGDDGRSRLGINNLGFDSAGWPYLY